MRIHLVTWLTPDGSIAARKVECFSNQGAYASHGHSICAKAMEPGAPQLHEKYPNNILKHTSMTKGDYKKAIEEPGLIKVEGWYDTPTVQHCHIENHGCFAYEENGRMTVVTSTQIPHIIRRVVGQALGRPWGNIRIIKPYIGGGFGNKQDALY